MGSDFAISTFLGRDTDVYLTPDDSFWAASLPHSDIHWGAEPVRGGRMSKRDVLPLTPQ